MVCKPHNPGAARLVNLKTPRLPGGRGPARQRTHGGEPGGRNACRLPEGQSLAPVSVSHMDKQRKMQALIQGESGATAMEYGLILGMAALVTFVGVLIFYQELVNLFGRWGGWFQNPNTDGLSP